MFFIPFLVLLAFASPAAAQSEQTPTFTSGVSNVRIDVQVTQDNELVTDLTRADFTVFDEGQQQPITYFGREAEPLSLVLLLDVSGSMKQYIEQVASVARESLRFLRPAGPRLHHGLRPRLAGTPGLDGQHEPGGGRDQTSRVG